MVRKDEISDLASASWLLAKDGELDAAARMLLKARSAVDRLVNSWKISSEDSEDVFAEVVIQYLRIAGDTASSIHLRVRNPAAYFMRLLHDAAAGVRKRSEYALKVDPTDIEDIESTLLGPEQRLENLEQLEAAFRILREAGEDYQLALDYALGEVTAAEVANIWGAPEHLVRIRLRDRLYVLRKRLKQALGEVEAEKKFPGMTYALAVKRGEEFRAAALSSPGEFLSLGQIRSTLPGGDKVLSEVGAPVISVRTSSNEAAYPAWQFQDAVRPHISRILDAMGEGGDGWSYHLFFTQPNPNLDGVTPIDALRLGQLEDVLAAAAASGFSEAGA